MTIVIFIIGILLFISLIVVHEFGHFIAAIRNGVEAEEFAIFFGPTIYQRKTKKGWVFKLNSLPLGGYVKLKGEHDSDVGKGTYGASSLWVKTKIMLAGIVVNFVTGLLLLTLLGLVGLPQIIPNQFSVNSNVHTVKHGIPYIDIGQVMKSSPASKAGLKSGDNITGLGPKGDIKQIGSVSDIQNTTKEFAGQYVQINYVRNNKDYQAHTVLNTVQAVSKNKNQAYLGIVINYVGSSLTLVRYTWAAPIVAVGVTKQVVVLSYQGLSQAIKGLGGIIAGAVTHNTTARKKAVTNANQLVGPVGIFYILKDGSSVGLRFILFFIAIISLGLAMINVLPIPVLDGGRLWLTLIARLFKRSLSQNVEELVNAIGMIVIMILFAVITYADIKRFH